VHEASVSFMRKQGEMNVPGEANTSNPMEVWKRWNETTVRMWSSILEESKQAYKDPFGLTRLWMKSMSAAQDQLQAQTDPSGGTDPITTWKQWIDATTDAWKRASEAGKDAVEHSGQWLRVLEETKAKLLSGEINAKDPIAFFKQWYDATNETWAQVLGEVMSSERFLEAQRQFIETYSDAVRVSNRLNEELFQTMQLPTSSDIARVAGLVVALEEKIDRIEDTLEGVESHLVQAGGDQAAEDRLEKRLQQLDHKLDTLLAALTKQAKAVPGTTQATSGTRRRAQKKQEGNKETHIRSASTESVQ
jgi:polyhydroxyalkanoic acid synthase PhaR subunit